MTLWMLVKPLPVLGLAVWVAANARGRAAWLVVAGLVLSLLADVLIEKWFLAGLAVFLVAHVAYVAAFLVRDSAPRLSLLLPFLAWGALMLWRLWPGLGELRVPVVLYSAVICAMMWRAAAASWAASEWITLLGAVLFAASDSLLALDKFHRPIPHASVAIMALYWAGQALMASAAPK